MIRGMEKSGKILKKQADLENIVFHYTGSYSIMRLLPCFHYILPTFCGQNFNVIDISKDNIDPSLQ